MRKELRMSKDLPVEVDDKSKRAMDRVKQHKKRTMLDTFAQLANIGEACKVAEISRASHYRWMHNDEDYAAAFREAELMASDVLIDELHRRATVGAEHVVTYEGKITDRYKIPSDLCLIFALKRLRPEFRDNYLANNFFGPIQLNVQFDSKAVDPLSGLLSKAPDDLTVQQGRAVDQARILEDRRRDDDGFDPEKH